MGEVSTPSVTRHGTILNRRGPFAYRDSILELPQTVALEARVPGAPDRAFGAQVFQKLFLKSTPRLDIKASVYRLMRHLIVRLPRVRQWPFSG